MNDMPLYVYKKELKSLKKTVINYISIFTIIVGVLLLFWAFYPVISFEVYSRLFIKKSFSSPVYLTQSTPDSIISENSVLGLDTLQNTDTDLTQANLWFPKAALNTQSKQKIFIKEYFLDIPKLNINNAKVIVGGDDLTKSLIHYIPNSLPGEKGNVVIFGHSTLPQLYDTKDYKTIFTYLSSLENGDLIRVRIGEDDYDYKVSEMFVVKPDKTEVLDQMYDASYLTLITCVPPGTYWNRLVIRAKLHDSLIEF